VDYGFRPDRILTMQVFLPANKYPVDNSQFRPLSAEAMQKTVLSKPATYFISVLDRLKNIPGVESAAAVSSLPLNEVAIDFDLPVVVEGRPRPKAGEEFQAHFRIASEDYFRTMDIPLRQGRFFNEFDSPANAAVIIVNQVFATQMFPNEDPVGRRIQLYGRSREVVGVVGAVRHYAFNSVPIAEMYVPHRQFMLSGMTLVVKTATEDPATLTSVIKSEIHRVDPDQPVYRFRTMEEFIVDAAGRPRFTTALLAMFAGLATVLSLVGVYGVMSYTVAQRSHEIGIRMALGAARSDVIAMILRDSFVMTLLGIAGGLAGAAILTRFLDALLFQVDATDPLTFTAVTLLLVVAAGGAAYVPARRATRIDPIVALREQ
jgi:putative ABC transport system permease protein